MFQGAPGLQQNSDTTGCGGLEVAPKKLWIFDLFFLGGVNKTTPRTTR